MPGAMVAGNSTKCHPWLQMQLLRITEVKCLSEWVASRGGEAEAQPDGKIRGHWPELHPLILCQWPRRIPMEPKVIAGTVLQIDRKGSTWQRPRQAWRHGSESPHTPAKERRNYGRGLGSEETQDETREFLGYFFMLVFMLFFMPVTWHLLLRVCSTQKARSVLVQNFLVKNTRKKEDLSQWEMLCRKKKKHREMRAW